MWNEKVNFATLGGHCDGMTTTSLRLFKDIDQQSTYQTGASTTHALDKGNIRRYITWNFVLQFANPALAANTASLQKTPNQVLQQIYLALQNNAPDPLNLGIFQGGSGHSILPYSIEDAGNGKYRVKVYDNNHHDDANRSVEFDTQANTWRYDLGGSTGVWSGNGSSHSIGVIPLSVYLQQPQCPWCSSGSWAANGLLPDAEEQTQTWLQGAGHLLISDTSGRRIGHVGDQFINEIPGASGNIPLTGLGLPTEPIYNVPASDSYRIQVAGVEGSQELSSITHFGPGYTVAADKVKTATGIGEELNVTSNGSRVSFTAGQQQELELTLASDETEHVQFKLLGVDLSNGNTVQVTHDEGAGKLSVSHAQAQGSLYTLEFGLITSGGLSSFLHKDIQMDEGNTQVFDYGTWDGAGDMTMCTDVGSNGTLDACSEISNETPHIYLPLVLN